MNPAEKIVAKVKYKESEKEKVALTKEINRMNEEMAEHRNNEDVPSPNEYTPFTPDERELIPVEESEVLPASPVLNLTADDLAKIIAAAKGDYFPSEREPLPPDATITEKVADFADDALGEVGRGAHRMADGCRDIIGGAIDIITLGRAHRR